MSRSNKIQAVIETAVGEILETALPKLRSELVGRAVQEMESLEPAPGTLPADMLMAATAAIQESTSQAEILRQLLDGVAGFCGRAALFVVKGGSMSVWQGTGFEGNQELKGFGVNASAGLPGTAIQARSPIAGQAQEFDPAFVGAVGAPGNGACLVLPLVVKEKVPALIYADAGQSPDSRVDASALTVLCRFAGLWLEITALRKAGGATAQEEAQPQPSVAIPQPIAAAAAAVSAGHQNGGGATAPVGEEDEVHKKAKRYARLLVDEIKLYNQAKVSEGRQSKDLYDRLREDIEKSRAAYDKRFVGSPAASANYFSQELVRILADNDISLMGGSFPH
jgi:hypothetical protein